MKLINVKNKSIGAPFGYFVASSITTLFPNLPITKGFSEEEETANT